MHADLDLATAVIAASAIVVGFWTYLVCKLVFLGKPRDVSVKAFGVEVVIRSHAGDALRKGDL